MSNESKKPPATVDEALVFASAKITIKSKDVTGNEKVILKKRG